MTLWIICGVIVLLLAWPTYWLVAQKLRKDGGF
jgi:peptidoglycan/LPS O-acetylase OafA/YrhL